MSFALLFKPSTGPDDSSPLARNQFKIRGLCERNILATRFIGAKFDCIVRVAQSSKNLSAHALDLYDQKRLAASMLENRFVLVVVMLR